MRRLRTEAVHAKQILSSAIVATVVVDALIDGIDFHTEITRIKFEELCTDRFTAAVQLVERALKDAKMDKLAIDEVVLVGGSTRIPKIQSMLQNYFCGKPLNCTINPDEAVAYGAAVQAAMLTDEGKKSLVLRGVQLFDIIPLSLGVAVQGTTMSKIIKRNTQIPCKFTKEFTTCNDNQTEVIFKVYQGENEKVFKNHLLGNFLLKGFAPAPAGTPDIYVTFDIDVDGILNVTVRDDETGRRNEIKINKDKGRLSQEEIDRMLSEAGLIKEHDEQEAERIEIKHQLEKYVSGTKQSVGDSSCKLAEEDKKEITNICNATIQWMKDNKNAKKEELKKKFDEVMLLMAKPMREKNAARKKLEKYVSSLTKSIEEENGDLKLKLDQDDIDRLTDICDDTEEWLRKNQCVEKEDYIGKLESVQNICDSILLKAPKIDSQSKPSCIIS